MITSNTSVNRERVQQPSATRSLPFRQIHLDFHTGPAIPDVGRDFDARAFARTMKEAHVNSVNVFAKCHHGHLYYRTARPERHPGLPDDLDLLRLQIDELHAVGIKAPIYISVQCDEYAANTYPGWIARNPDGTQVGANPFVAGWQIMDMSSPYQDFLAEQTAEILDYFHPVDGIWFDMCWDQPSCSRYAIDKMRIAGFNPENQDDRQAYAHQVAQAYMRRFYAMVKTSSPDALVYINGRHPASLHEEIDCFEQLEIESLPTGMWGYMYFPKTVRGIRTLGKPYLGMTARFHKSWADFGGLKPYAALEYETSQMVAHGARCSIGDQLHPRGILDPAAYELIGKVYARIEAREPWLEDAESIVEIGVLQSTQDLKHTSLSPDEGATRMLTQLKHQFDFIHASSDLNRYALIILPDAVQVDAAFANKLNAYLAAGGKMLASGVSGLTTEGTVVILPSLGVKPVGISPFSCTYIRYGDAVSNGIPSTDHIMYDPGVRVIADGAEVLATVVEPYFERTWEHFSSHFQTPSDQESPYAAAVMNNQTAYIAYPIFSAYAKHGNLHMRSLVGNILSLMLPDPLLKVTAPSSTETTVTRQPGRNIVHLLQYCPERRANIDIVEDIVPLFNIPLSLRAEHEPKRVYLAPEGTEIPFTCADGYIHVQIPEIRGHTMVVFDE